MQFNLGKVISKIGYFYVVLPFCIFLCGWCKWYVWVPGMLIITFCMVQLMRKSKIDFKITLSLKNILIIIGVVVIALLWVYLSGIGGLTYQNDDHQWRNQIFQVLVKYDWPVIGEYKEQPLLLVYYIAFWMPAALVGKAFGIEAGFAFQVVWAVIGILLVYGLICVVMKKFNLWPFLVFVFFSGLDMLGRVVFNSFYEYQLTWSSHIERWSGFEFSSNTTLLFWVFNQAILSWVILLLIMVQKNNRFRIFLLSFSLLACTFSFVGMIPFILYWIFKDHIKNNGGKTTLDWKNMLKDVFSLENILGGGFVGALTILYLMDNRATSSSMSAIFNPATIAIGIIGVAAVVTLIYLLYKFRTRSTPFYVLAVFLTVISFAAAALGSDEVCEKAVVPLMVILLLFIIDRLYNIKNGNKTANIVFICIMSAGLLGTAAIFATRVLNATLKGGLNSENWNVLVLKYIVGITIDFLLYYIAIFKYQRKNWIYHITLLFLLVCPWIVVGESNDFCMRASIPALFMLYIMVVDSIYKAAKEKSRVLLIVLIVMLFIGSFTATTAMVRAVVNPVSANTTVSEKRLWRSKNFTGTYEDNFFGKYLMGD